MVNVLSIIQQNPHHYYSQPYISSIILVSLSLRTFGAGIAFAGDMSFYSLCSFIYELVC